MSKEVLRKLAVQAALRHVRDGTILGLGSGTTMRLFTEMLAKKVRDEGLDIKVIPTSSDAELHALKLGLKVASLNEYPSPDLAIDGADVVDQDLNLVKGGGGALTREKIVDYSAKEYIIVIDKYKLVDNIFSHKIPVEVLPFSWKSVLLKLSNILSTECELRMSTSGKLGPVITDNGNYVLDIRVENKNNPKELEKLIKQIPGVIEVGIFSLKKPKEVIVGAEKGVFYLRK